MYTELIINGESYKLRLNTRASINLEKALGKNPLIILMDASDGKLPKITDIILMLQAMLQTYHHGYNLDKTMDLFDAYVEDGNSMIELIPVLLEVFQSSGYISKNVVANGEETEAKN